MPFFKTSASSKKRKREDVQTQSTTQKKRTTGAQGASKASKERSIKPKRDESISGSGSDDEGSLGRVSDQEIGSSSDSGNEDETGADRRRRLAEQYLENLKGNVDEVGFDAEEVDRDLIAERLQEDAAESKGRAYRQIASTLSFAAATRTYFRADTLATTSIAVYPPYAYTVSKDFTLIKWKLPTLSKLSHPNSKPSEKPPPPLRRRPEKLCFVKGDKNKAGDRNYKHHIAPILTVAASPSGKYVVTGGADKRLIVWSASELKALRIFTDHRDAVTGLAFRRGADQLYSSSKDRTVKTWNLDALAYVETLFGHQDEVVDVAALSLERCVSVGARDRTARLWRIVEETQLVFRGGGSSEKRKHNRHHLDGDVETGKESYGEGSIDRVAMIDEENWVTGSDNGNISLWSLHRKKPVFTIAVAHGLDPALTPEEAFAEEDLDRAVPAPPQPRWITALATVPYTDLIVSGSWDGWIRVWKVTQDKRRLEEVGAVGCDHSDRRTADGEDKAGLEDRGMDNPQEQASVQGIINDIKVFERGERGKDGLCIVAAVGKDHRLGRWKKVRGKNGAVIFEVSKTVSVLPTEGRTQVS